MKNVQLNIKVLVITEYIEDIKKIKTTVINIDQYVQKHLRKLSSVNRIGSLTG